VSPPDAGSLCPSNGQVRSLVSVPRRTHYLDLRPTRPASYGCRKLLIMFDLYSFSSDFHLLRFLLPSHSPLSSSSPHHPVMSPLLLYHASSEVARPPARVVSSKCISIILASHSHLHFSHSCFTCDSSRPSSRPPLSPQLSHRLLSSHLIVC
jgi:hypothetical protein